MLLLYFSSTGCKCSYFKCGKTLVGIWFTPLLHGLQMFAHIYV